MTPEDSRKMVVLINSERFVALPFEARLQIRDELLDKKIQTFEELEDRITRAEQGEKK